jgi:tetratricopeptide (TPR) repeat protein
MQRSRLLIGGILMEFIKIKLFCRMTVVSLLFTFFLFACSSTPRVQERVLNTPEHHAYSGFKLLKKDYLFDAKREFKLALQLDSHYSNAHLGLGLTYGKEKRFKLALDSMCSARDDAKTEEEKALAFVGFMRLYMMRGGEGWLAKVKERFYDSLHYKEDLPEAYFYMGIAYKKANRLYRSKNAFKKVLQINKGLVAESKEELKTLGKSGE